MQVVAFRLTCLSSKTLQNIKKNCSPTLSKCVHRHARKLKTNSTDMHKLTSSELCFTSLQCFIKKCFAFASVSREKQKSVFHMTAVLHMTVSGHQLWVSFRLVCIWFQIRHAKTKLWFLHAKKNKVAHPPFKLNWRRPETCKNQFHLPRKFPMETRAHAGQKKTFHLVFHALCRQHTFRDPSYLHVLRPKWPWQVLCCKHLSGSNSRHTSQHACRTRTNQTSS